MELLVLESIFLVFIGSKLFIFFFRWADPFNDESVLMLYYTAFFLRWLIDLTYWNYISSIFFFFLSLILPFIHTLYFLFRLTT